MSNEVQTIEVQIARGVPKIFKIFCLACGTVGVYYSYVLGSLLSLGGWVLVVALMWCFHIMERAAVSYHNQHELLKSLLQIKVLEREGTIDIEGNLTIRERKNGNETKTSTNGE